MLKNQSFPGLRPGPAGELTALAAPSPKTLSPLSAFGPRASALLRPRFYGFQGLTHYRVGNPSGSSEQKHRD